MMTVKLYGHLGRKFGRIHHFDIKTPREAMRALMANFRDFAGYMRENSEPGYRVITDMGDRSIEQLADPMSGQSIKIVPVIAGAKSGWGQIILGAVLVAIDYVGFGAYDGGALSNIGWAMIVGGAAQVLFAPATPQQNQGGKNSPSYAFSGPVNTSGQGNPVPVCYGRLMVGGQVVSGGMYAAQIPL